MVPLRAGAHACVEGAGGTGSAGSATICGAGGADGASVGFLGLRTVPLAGAGAGSWALSPHAAARSIAAMQSTPRLVSALCN